jgi:hypothetical protein
VSKRERRDSDRWSERRESQPEEEQQRRSGESDAQEGDSLAALKAILSKVAAVLKPLQLTPEESIRLVEQLYGSVLETDLRLAGEADDTRKSSVLALIQNTTITRDGDRIVVEFPTARSREPEQPTTVSPASPSPVRSQAPAARDAGRGATGETAAPGAPRALESEPARASQRPRGRSGQAPSAHAERERTGGFAHEGGSEDQAADEVARDGSMEGATGEPRRPRTHEQPASDEPEDARPPAGPEED